MDAAYGRCVVAVKWAEVIVDIAATRTISRSEADPAWVHAPPLPKTPWSPP